MKLLRSGLSYKSLHLMVDLLQMNNISCLATGRGKTKLTPLKIQFDSLTVTLRSFPLPLLQASNYISYNYHLSRYITALNKTILHELTSCSDCPLNTQQLQCPLLESWQMKPKCSGDLDPCCWLKRKKKTFLHKIYPAQPVKPLLRVLKEVEHRNSPT